MTTAARSSNIDVVRRRDRDLHVHQPQARPDRGRQGRHARRPAGLHLHGRRRPQPGELPARRRRRRDALEHAHLRQRRARAAATRVSETVPTGWDQTGATCDDGSPVSNIDVSAGETVTCTFTNRKRGQIVVVKDAAPERRPGLRLHRRRRPEPGELRARRRLRRRRCSNTRTFTNVVPGSGYSLSRPCRAAGTRPAPPATTAARSRTSTVAPARPSPAPSPTASAARSWSSRTRRRTTPGLRLHGRRRPQPRELLARRRLRPDALEHPAPSANVAARRRLLGLRDRAGRLGPDQRHLQTTAARSSNIDVAPGETVTCTFINRKRGKIIVIKDATPDDPQDFSFTAGGGLSPVELLARRRRRPDALEHAHVRQRRPGRLGYSLAETVPAGWDQTSATCDDGSPRVEHRRQRRARPSPARSPTASAGRSSSSRTRRPTTRRTSRFTAGGGLSPVELPARRRLQRDALEHAHVRERGARRRLLALRDRAQPAGTRPAPRATTAARSRTSTSPPARPSPARSTTASAARIVVVKDAPPNDPQDFAFTAGGGLSPTSFQLDDDSDGDAVEHAHLHRRRARVAATRSPRPCPSGWDQTARHV